MNKIDTGDLVATYLTNTGEWETLLQWGIVLEVSALLDDVLVIDQNGYTAWYPRTRWRLLKKKVDAED